MEDDMGLMDFVCAGSFVIFIILATVFMCSHAVYEKEGELLRTHMTIAEVMNSDNELKQTLYEYTKDSDKDNGLYDIVNLNKESASYLEWLKTRDIKVGISSIEENTETFKSEGIEVTSEIRNNNKVYIVGDLVLKAKDDISIKDNAITEIEIHYAKDQKENDIIVDYTVVYQK